MTAKPCKTMGRFTNFADVLSENCKFWPCLIYVTTLCICKSRYKYNVWPPWPAVCLFCSFLGSLIVGAFFRGVQLWKTHSPTVVRALGFTSLEDLTFDRLWFFYPGSWGWMRLEALMMLCWSVWSGLGWIFFVFCKARCWGRVGYDYPREFKDESWILKV